MHPLRLFFVLAKGFAVAGVISTWIAPSARALEIYWSNVNRSGSNMIGGANLDGTGVNQSFIPLTTPPNFIAVDQTHIYWGSGGNAIGRANLDGTAVNESFMTGARGPEGVAVDGNYIYWADLDDNTIGRANLDGTGVNNSFITGASHPEGLAVDGTHIYWANNTSNTIGRANLDGTAVNQSFITSFGASGATGVAVDGAHIYYASYTLGLISRGNLDGTGELPFVGAQSPLGIAVDGTFIYWTNQEVTIGGGTTIGRARLDGTSVTTNFIALDPLSQPVGVAIVPVPEPATASLVLGGVLGLAVRRHRQA